MRSATLISWLVTASLGAFMLRTWLARGGLSVERAKKDGLPPQLIFGHATAALTGLLCWVAFLVSGARPLAWGAVALLAVAVGLGLCTVTLWTPYPARKPGERRTVSHGDIPARGVPDAAAVPPAPPGAPVPDERVPAGAQPSFEVTDEMIARFLAAPGAMPGPRTIRPNPAVLIPVVHGFAAIITFMLALVSAIT
jgi:hypothetical protein